MRKAAICIEIL